MVPTTVLTSRADGILTLTLNRPEKLNAIDPDLARALLAALEAKKNDDAVRVVVLNGGRDLASGTGIHPPAR